MSIEVRAQNTLSMTSVKAIKEATDQSAQLLAEMEQYAEDAGTTLTGIYQDAMDAQASADSAQRSATNASEYASRALGNLSTVQSVTETLNWITQHGTMTLTTDTAIDPTHVYFVVDANGDYVVNSTHYAIVTEPDVADLSTYYELSIDESLNNYVGTHLALTSEGLWLLPASSGTNKVLIATGAGSTYTTAGTYIIDENNTALASFTANGATVGKANGAHTTVDANGMRVFTRSGALAMANIGYGAGASQSGTTEDAPYYTLGHRPINSTIGNYSVAEGSSTTASGYCSHAEGGSTASGNFAHAEGSQTTASGGFAHAEGVRTTASGGYSHAEGSGTTASGLGAHTEGYNTTASGLHSHAEGENTVAEGHYSHAGGNYTIANAKSQTVIGEYNEADTTSHAGLRGSFALIIGNGRADDARSNAFTVDWNGNVVASGDITDGHGNTLTQNYTSTPVPIGKLNGQTIMRKVFTGNTPTTSGGTVFSDPCLDTLINMSGYVLNTGNSRLILPAYFVSTTDYMVMYAQSGVMKFAMGSTAILGNRPYVCIVDYLA